MEKIISDLILLAPPLLLALTFHEFSHGYVANQLGDPTARLAGRLTMNPIKHLDPIGTLAFFFVKFGWAKPVPVNPSYFRDPRKGMLWVALAGPLSNLFLAIVSAIVVKILIVVITPVRHSAVATSILLPFLYMTVKSVWINLMLSIFNLLPVPPLDGGRILGGLLPEDMYRSYMKIEPYGFVIVVLLSFSGVLSFIISPVLQLANSLLLP